MNRMVHSARTAGFILVVLCCAMPAKTLRYWIQPGPDAELAQWAMSAWQAASGGRLTLEGTDRMERAHIRLFWATGREGLYGEARPIMVDGVRGAEVYVLPTIVPPEEKDTLLRDAIVYLTCVHETGHALGLAHTADFADIMYSFGYGGDITAYFARYRRQLKTRADIRTHDGLSENDRKRIVVISSQ